MSYCGVRYLGSDGKSATAFARLSSESFVITQTFVNPTQLKVEFGVERIQPHSFFQRAAQCFEKLSGCFALLLQELRFQLSLEQNTDRILWSDLHSPSSIAVRISQIAG